MPTLTIGEARARFEKSRSELRALLEMMAELDQEGVVIDLRHGSGPSGPVPPPPVFSKCVVPDRGYLMVADYVAGVQGLVDWLRDFIDSLAAPGERPFDGGELPRT